MSSASRDPRVFRAQLELVYRLSERSLIAAFVFSTILAVFYVGPERRGVALAWWLFLNLSAVVRVYLGRRFLGNTLPDWSLGRWEALAVLGSLSSGAAWGFFIVTFAPPWGDIAYPIAVFMAAGVPAVALAAHSGYLPSYVAVVAPILGPHALQLIFWSDGSPFEVLGGFAAIIYLLVLIGIGHAINLRIVEAFELRFGNQDLVERLKTSNLDLAEQVQRREATEHGLREARAAAEAANEAKSRFLARMSHEIRTPLNGILGMTEILRQTALSPGQMDHAEAIDEAGRSLLRVINDILDFSKVEAGKLALQSADFAIREVVDRSVALLEPKARAKGLRLVIDIADAVPATLRGDAGRLRQVLVNLIGNAVKFTEAGEVAVRVFPQDPAGDAGDLRFEIADTGIGIEADAQGRLFQPFAQSDESHSREHGGTGLGLVIAQQLVQLMGGAIGFRSTRGSGSTFWFTARFAPAGTTQAVAVAPAPTADELRGRLGGRVLLVDDIAVNRLIGAEFLRVLGCTIEEAEDGEEALQRLGEGAFDLVLMDCEMPRMDGYRASIEIRRREADLALPRIPVVAVTASALTADRERALAAGMDDYVSKPFSLLDLYRVIAPFLTNSGISAAAAAGSGGQPLQSSD